MPNVNVEVNLVDRFKNTQDLVEEDTMLHSEKVKPPLYLRKKEQELHKKA
jgi:hypothetical protein